MTDQIRTDTSTAPVAGTTPANEPKNTEQQLARLFRRAGDGPAIQSLLRAVRDYRQQETACKP